MNQPAPRLDPESDLARYEAVIERGLATFLEVGSALLEIRDRGLYRESHGTFEDYCRERWNLARSTAYQLIDAAQVVADVRNCGQSLPANEAQARPLVSLTSEQRREVWQEAVNTAPNGKPTAKHVAEVAARHKPESAPPSSRPLPDQVSFLPPPDPPARPEIIINLGAGPAFPPTPERTVSFPWENYADHLNNMIINIREFGDIAGALDGCSAERRTWVENHLRRFRDYLDAWLRHLEAGG